MSIQFLVTHDSKTHELSAEKVHETESLDIWRVYSRADRNVFLELSNDRPLLHAMHQYKQRFKWTVMDGSPQFRKMSTQITTYLDYYVKGLWKPPTKGVNEKKAAAAKQQGKLF